MKNCEVCLSTLSGPKLDFGFHPLPDDLLPIGSMDTVKKYHQELVLCTNCLTAQHMHQVNKETLFSKNYHYRAALTKDVLDGMLDLVRNTLSRHLQLNQKISVLDIGCNDGSLLGIFKQNIDCITIGVDPTNAILEHQGKIDFPIQSFFNVELANEIYREHGFPDIITFTNVFAHIEDFQGLLVALKQLIGPETVLVIENHYLGSILKDKQFDTFYHEHPRTYSAKSFWNIANQLGLSILELEFPKRYGGNIRVSLGKTTNTAVPTPKLPNEDEFNLQFESLQSEFENWVTRTKEDIYALASKGAFVGKALPARAVMLISCLGLDSDVMPYVFEQPNSPKIGHYVPGTRIEIVSDADLVKSAHSRVVLWSWHIAEEVSKYLRALGFNGQIWVPLPEFSQLGQSWDN